MATNFCLESVRDCILERGGRIRNHELVTYFKSFLNDPENKVANREKFKDFVNELATIKLEDGEKVLVLKKKYRPDTLSSDSLSSSSHSSSVSNESASQQYSINSSIHNNNDSNRSVTSEGERSVPASDMIRARSEPPASQDSGSQQSDRVDGMMMSKVYSDESLDVKVISSTRPESFPKEHKKSLDDSSSSLASVGSQSSGVGVEEDGNLSVLSVRQRAQHLNKISSEVDLNQARTPPRKKSGKEKEEEEESHSSSSTDYVALTQDEKEWMVACAGADYHEMNRLLSKKPALAKVKTLSNGYTALHWAAKSGKPEIVKLIANKINVNVNQRSQGGYTPLHLAAIHGHEEILELLVTTYKADVNIRDYSGKKPKQYLKNSAASRIQHLLTSKRNPANLAGRTLDDCFLRAESSRKSNRQKAISSLLQASSVMRQPSLRSSVEVVMGDDSGNERRTPNSTPPGSNPVSPLIGRKQQCERDLMPPPSGHYRRPRPDRSKSSSRESLSSNGGS